MHPALLLCRHWVILRYDKCIFFMRCCDWHDTLTPDTFVNVYECTNCLSASLSTEPECPRSLQRCTAAPHHKWSVAKTRKKLSCFCQNCLLFQGIVWFFYLCVIIFTAVQDSYLVMWVNTCAKATPARSLKVPSSFECERRFHFISLDFHIINYWRIGQFLSAKEKAWCCVTSLRCLKHYQLKWHKCLPGMHTCALAGRWAPAGPSPHT